MKSYKKTKRRKKALRVTLLQKGGSKANHAKIEAAVRFYAAELMSTRMCNLLNIRVEMRKTIPKQEKWVQGTCATNTYQKSQVAREFKIVLLREQPLKEQLIILAHEMIHVKQKATGELSQKWYSTERAWKRYWKGEETNLPYRELPWEIEAYANQEKLYRKLTYNKLKIKREKIFEAVMF